MNDLQEMSTNMYFLLSSLTFVCSLLASVAGTGGGSLFIPIFSLAFPNDLHKAVPLAKTAVFGVAVGACCLNILKSRETGPAINYRLATLIQPATLLGCLIGVFLNLALRSWMISLALVCVLGFTAAKTFQSGLAQLENDAPVSEHLADVELEDVMFSARDTNPTLLDARLGDTHSRHGDTHSRHGDTQLQVHSRQASSILAETRLQTPLANRRRKEDAPAIGREDSINSTRTASALLDVSPSNRPASTAPYAHLNSQLEFPSHDEGDTTLHILSQHSDLHTAYQTGLTFLINESKTPLVTASPAHDEVFDTPKPIPTKWRVSSYAESDGAISRKTPLYLDSSAPQQSFKEAFREVLMLGSVWAVNLTALCLAGGPAAIACGSTFERSVIGGLAIFLVTFVCFSARRFHAYKLWWATPAKMWYYCILSCLAGIGAGMLGIGGGLIKGPLLISIGLTPVNAVATSNYMIFFTSSTNVASFFISGRLDLLRSGIFAVTSLCGGLCGVSILRRSFRSKANQPLLTFTLAVTIVIGGLAMLGVNMIALVDPDHEEISMATACATRRLMYNH